MVLGLEDIEYEPEQFPGLIYRHPDLGTTMLLFASGKVIISGTTDKNVAQDSVSSLVQKIAVLEEKHEGAPLDQYW